MKTFEPSGITKAILVGPAPRQLGARREGAKSVSVDRLPDSTRGLFPDAGPAMQHAIEGRHADAYLPSNVFQSEMARRHIATHWRLA